MKTFYISLILLIIISLNIKAQDVKAKLAGHQATNGFTVVDDEDNVLFKVTGEGNVGIGTSTPTNLFEISSEYASEGDVAKSIEINAQSSSFGLAGSITLRSGYSSSVSNNGGDLNLYSGGSQTYGGNVNIISGGPGGGSIGPGDINIHTGHTNHYGGKISIYTEEDNAGGGGIEIYTKRVPSLHKPTLFDGR